MFDNNFGTWTDFQNSFTSWFVRKFSMSTHKNFHLTCNMLLYYMWNSKIQKCYRIFTLNLF